jgi:FecR protein
MTQADCSSRCLYIAPRRENAPRCARLFARIGDEREETMMRALFLAAALAAPCLANSADALGTITILEGQAQIYRDSVRLHAAEGVRLAPGDIVETAPGAFAQIELLDRSVAQLGPATRVMFGTATAKARPERGLFVMDGWLKVIAGKRNAEDPGFELRSAQFEMAPPSATLVLRATAAGAEIFVESGSIRLAERQERGANAPATALKAGDFYQRKPPARGSVVGIAPAAFVADMPRPFRDTLPPRIDRFVERPVQPRDAGAFSYADVQAWLQAEPALRRPLMQRWRAKAHEPAFRNALIANLKFHPEWDPILFPEKYKPKPPRPPAKVAPAPAASAASSAEAR